MLHELRFPAGRKLLAALLPSVLAAPALLSSHAAHAASMMLLAEPGDVHLCQATVWSRHSNYAVTQSGYLRVHEWGVSWQIGAFPAGAADDTPTFGALKLRCWIGPPQGPGGAPSPAQPSYSLTLDRDDGAWEVLPAGSEQLVSALPRDGHTLFLVLERTASADHPLRIAYAALSRPGQPSPYDVVYGALMHRYFDAD
jgi:hypothetical protein